MKPKRVTLADIAKADGTHVTTVSLALRNSPRLPESTRTRIQKLAESMGYAPDPMLRALVSYRESTRERPHPQVIAYVTGYPTRYGWKNVTAHPGFHEGAKKRAQQLGYSLEHFWLREPGLTHDRLSRILYNRGIRGVILASHTRDIDETVNFEWQHFSGVKIDYFPHRPQLHNVTNDQCSIIRLAMRRVIENGYKRIGFVMHRGWDHSVDRLWSAGFLVEQHQLPDDVRIPMYIYPAPYPVENWMGENEEGLVPDPESFQRWFNTWKPEVIISRSAFVEPCLKELGIRVPEDVAYVDLFLDDDTGKTAGVRQNHEDVGALAVEILAGKISQNKMGIPNIPTTTFVEGTWINGESLPLPEGALEEATNKGKESVSK